MCDTPISIYIPAVRIDQTYIAIAGLIVVAGTVIGLAHTAFVKAKERRADSRRKVAPSPIIETAIKQTLAKIAVSAALIVIIAVAIGRH